MQEGAKKSTSWKGGERFVKFLDAQNPVCQVYNFTLNLSISCSISIKYIYIKKLKN